MPQYEYTCRNCRKKFTKMLTLAEFDKKKNSMKCPHCGSKKTERLWAAFFAVGSKS